MKQQSLDSLRARLEEFYDWPSPYTFKFIVPKEKLEELIPILEGRPYSTRDSANGRFVSVTSEFSVSSSEEVLKIYRAAFSIEGLISL